MSERSAVTEGAHILCQIRPQLSEDDELYARVLLEKSAVMRADPTMVTTICRVRRVLSTKPLRLHSVVLRTVIEQLAIEGGVSAYVAIWLQEVDEALRTIVQSTKERYGTEALKALDGEAQRLGLPTWFWWEYPARTAEEASPKLL